MLKRGSWNNLPQGVDRMLAKIATMANNDTWGGGCNALMIADRALALGLPHAREMRDAVSLVYSTSSGRVPDGLAVWECPECGQWHLGDEAAASCCAQEFIESD